MTTPEEKPYATRHRRRNTLLAIASVVTLAAIVLVVLFFTALRPKQAVTSVTSVDLDGVRVGFDPRSNVGLALNVTVLLGLSVHNPNRASFRYREGRSEVFYRGALVGEASVPPGYIGAHGTVHTVARLVVMAGRLVAAGDALSDALYGTLDFTTHTRIPGKAKVLGVFKVRMVMYTTCKIRVNAIAWTVRSSDCRSRTKF